MAYRIRRGKSVQKGVRAIAREQIDKAIGEIEDAELDRHEAVHQVRKRCKKLRGLVRLVRPVFPAYRAENRFFRDAARDLSYVRDAQSTLDCLDALRSHYQDQVDWQRFAPVRRALAQRRQRIAEDRAGLEEKLHAFLGRMYEARGRVDCWQLGDDGYAAVQDGLRRTYRRGRKALRSVVRDPSTENLHEWRKRVKYHWYHARLVRRIWPDMLQVHRDAADNLADLLGDDHDLAVMRQAFVDDDAPFGNSADLQTMLGLIDQRRGELQSLARPLGERLFAEKPRCLVARFHVYWGTWKADR